MQDKKQFVIDLGGSAVCPDGIDVEFLKRFREFIKRKIGEGYRFIIVVGGGGICRQYQKAAGEVVDVTDRERDWVGIFATSLNARLLRAIFCDAAHPDLFDERFRIKEFGDYSIIVGAGWEPGCSTDFVAIQIATDFKIDTVVNLGKPDYVYTADPGKDASAKPIEKLPWADYWKMTPLEWTPGLNFPLDPIAAKLAEKENIRIIVAGARDLDNLEKILDGKEFKGTALY
ncbi:MAG: UMP kinase [Candidatus Portnoybacteria bacterium]|nr:UMP kinase [Candidatus Portnoybacteria bacterium]